MITVSPGHFGPGTGAKDIIDEVTEAIKVASTVTSLLRANDVIVSYVEDKKSKSQNANISYLIAEHNKTSRQLDVSIHFNKVGNRTDLQIGVEVLYYGDATKALAERVSKAISDASGLKNRGAKQRTNLGLLKGTNKPCILIEVCFVESTYDVALYKEHYQKICEAIAKELAAVVGKSISFEKKSIIRDLHINSKSLADATDAILSSAAQRKIIVDYAVKNGLHTSWLDKLANRTITDDELLALAAKSIVDANK